MIVDITTFEKFQRIVDSDSDVVTQLLETAEAIVVGYLKYDPTKKDYDCYFDGQDKSYIELGSQPINSVTSVTVNGTLLASNTYIYRDDEIVLTNNTVFPSGIANIHVVFNAGYATVPSLIKQTIIRIAGLLLSEDGGNIGITSKTLDGGMTRTFFKTTNFDPYLIPLNQYRLFKL